MFSSPLNTFLIKWQANSTNQKSFCLATQYSKYTISHNYLKHKGIYKIVNRPVSDWLH